MAVVAQGVLRRCCSLQQRCSLWQMEVLVAFNTTHQLWTRPQLQLSCSRGDLVVGQKLACVVLYTALPQQNILHACSGVQYRCGPALYVALSRRCGIATNHMRIYMCPWIKYISSLEDWDACLFTCMFRVVVGCRHFSERLASFFRTCVSLCAYTLQRSVTTSPNRTWWFVC